MHEMSLEKRFGGLSKNINYRRVVQIKNINRRSGPIDIHRRVVHKQIIYQSSERPNRYIYTSKGCPQTNKIIIFIRGLGECDGVGEDSGSELVM